MSQALKVTDPSKIVTDELVLRELERQGIDKDYVEFFHDYAPRSKGKEYSPYAKFYRDLKSGKHIAIISGLPKVKALGHKIEPGWLYAKGKFYSKANLFSAIVNGKRVQVTCLSDQPDGRKLNDRVTWHPELSLSGIEQGCGKATLLETDPTNENCYQNVLEWDYGICKRRLRIIEGWIREYWLFTEDPGGEVRIKHNSSGNMPLNLGAIHDSDIPNKTHLTVEGDEEIIPAKEFVGKVYPIEVGGSPGTFYGSTSDGQVQVSDNVKNTAHNSADGSNCNNKNKTTDADYVQVMCAVWGDYFYARAFLYLDTSGLPSGCSISVATLSLYGRVVVEDQEGFMDLGIFEGVQDDPLEFGDYGDHLSKTTLGLVSYYDADTFAVDDYNAKALNDTGKGWISKTGVTKLCLPVKGDVDNSAITDENYASIWAQEKGTGYKPKLVVTYTVAEDVYGAVI